MILGIADDLDAPSVFGDSIALGNGIHGVVCALGLNVGMNLADDGAHIELRKDHNSIDVGERSHDLGAFVGRHDRPPFAFESADGLIGIDSHDKLAAQRLRAAKVADMSDVQQIETAVGESNALASAAPFLRAAAQRFPAQDFVLCVQWGRVAGGDCSSACNNSSRETVAVPRFMTTMPAA